MARSDDQEQRVRTLLHHTWHPFYGRFGRLRAIQRAAADPIVMGGNVLVGAPTASGKTEAVAAPLIERLFRQLDRVGSRRSDSELRLMFISPTRALSRDLVRRLQRPVRDCGMSVDIKTGDAAPVDLHNDPPDLLVTTPESLDSLLCRKPKTLREVRGIVLDELHLLDGTPRGDQLRCGLVRLKQVTRSELQICGASATLPNGGELARKYLGEHGQFLQRGGDSGKAHRDVEAELADAGYLEQAVDVIVDTFKNSGDRKLLVFANNRQQVEELTAQLSDVEILRDRVYAHHGSLAKAERLRAEAGLRDSPSAVCVATMTLEVGIDIGDVDRTILVGPPPDVSSLLQRIGRANRQEDVTRVTCLHAGKFERQRVEHLLECAARGELFAEEVPFRPSVIPQQALSLLFQNPKRWIAAEPLWKRLPRAARKYWAMEDCQEVLENLVADNFLHPMEGGKFAPDEEALHALEYGRFHSNIEDDDEVEVVDELTRQVVGKVRFRRSQAKELHEGKDMALALGGKKRKVVHYSDNQLVVRSEEGLEEAQFIASIPPRYSRGLAADFARFLGVEPGTMYLEATVDENWMFFHFLGTVWGRVLEQMLRSQGLVKKRGTHGAFYIELYREPAGEFLGFQSREGLEDAADEAVESNLEELVRLLGAGPFARFVPRQVLERWVRHSLELGELLDLLATADVREGGVLE